ncbi:MAG: prepilin-type N-terminal cleavage/methylation domain-containing protein [Rickettsiales bacterium]|jgi:prepilin-type N-terminal cleavage/methylation domain-containing protein
MSIITKKKLGFSLLELSIVLLVISLLAFGAIKGSAVIGKAKIASAASLTKSSVVGKMNDLALWYETTMPDSINYLEASNNSVVSVWRDISNISFTAKDAQSTLTNQPFYIVDGINGLPVLRFDGANDFFTYDGSFLANSDYTIFVVEQRRSASKNFFLGGSDLSTTNGNLHLGYFDTDIVYFALYNNFQDSAVTSYSSPTPVINSFRFNSSNSVSKTYYRNGVLQTLVCNTCDAAASLISYNGAMIGSAATETNFFNGDIAEIIMFTRALSNQERLDIEEYLGRKWGIKIE